MQRDGTSPDGARRGGAGPICSGLAGPRTCSVTPKRMKGLLSARLRLTQVPAYRDGRVFSWRLGSEWDKSVPGTGQEKVPLARQPPSASAAGAKATPVPSAFTISKKLAGRGGFAAHLQPLPCSFKPHRQLPASLLLQKHPALTHRRLCSMRCLAGPFQAALPRIIRTQVSHRCSRSNQGMLGRTRPPQRHGAGPSPAPPGAGAPVSTLMLTT